MTSTETEWRAEPNPDLDQIDNWRVCYEIAGIRYDIAIELEEQDARLIANAFAKARLCEELAEKLQFARGMLMIEAFNNRERGEPKKAEPTEGFANSITELLIEAGLEDRRVPPVSDDDAKHGDKRQRIKAGRAPG